MAHVRVTNPPDVPRPALDERVLVAIRTAVAEFMAETNIEGWRP
jgi:hypothetical protein